MLIISLNSLAQRNDTDMSDLKFETMLNAPVKSVSIGQLKGKVLLIDFWATWCGSCLEAMPHLKELQAANKTKLQVITVTQETRKRTLQYLASRPSALWFAIDTGGFLTTRFPHQLLPHSVLISPSGRYVAATGPEAITNLVIDSIYSGKEVHLSIKKDILLEPDDLLSKEFSVADTVKSRFFMRSPIAGSGGFSTTYPLNEKFSGRRITAVNNTILELYNLAYGRFTYNRLIDSTGAKNKKESYCMDLIVEDPKDLYPTMRQELSRLFDVQARIKQVTRQAYTLVIADEAKFAALKRNTDGKRTFLARHGDIHYNNVALSEFAWLLEAYGGLNGPVLDETGNGEKFDIDLSFQTENPQSLNNALKNMGLSLIKVERKVDMLLVFNKI